MSYAAAKFTPEELAYIKRKLKERYRTLEIAAEKLNMSKYSLSRMLNDNESPPLSTWVKVLKGARFLDEKHKYMMPREDWRTFCFVNGINTVQLLPKKGGAK